MNAIIVWPAVIGMAVISSAAVAQNTWKPERNVEIVVGSSAGTN